jgi:hypothetical protein
MVGKAWSASAMAAEEGDSSGGLDACVKETRRAISEEAPVTIAVKFGFTESIGGVSEMMPPGKFTGEAADKAP